MTKEEQSVIDYLKLLKKTRENCHIPKEFVYHGYEDFLLQHGRFYRPGTWTQELRAPKACYANSLLVAVQEPDRYRYVEGVALNSIGFPLDHGWVADAEFKAVPIAYDPTWAKPGLVYFGVEFNVRRAWESQWDGDGRVLNDWMQGHPLLKQRWTGETAWKPLTMDEIVRRTTERELAGSK